MASITDPITDNAKILLIGKSGAGKTGSLASLVAAGYKLRIIDTDKGVKTLRSLLTDERYPYIHVIRAKGIDLNLAVRYVPIDTSTAMRTVQRKVGEKYTMEKLLAPVDAKAWDKATELLAHWKEADLDLGPVTSWGNDVVLVIDSFSTLAKTAYYFSQALNNRLGARDEGFDYQRDIGNAQSQLTRLLEMLYNSEVKCNVIVISHITWVDESQGVASRPREAGKDSNIMPAQPDGYPSAIGRALSPQMGKYFNDTYIVRATGSGSSVRREISTVPTEGVIAKHSVYLNREYPVVTGLAQIFAAQRGEASPTDLINALNKTPTPTPTPQTTTTTAAQPR